MLVGSFSSVYIAVIRTLSYSVTTSSLSHHHRHYLVIGVSRNSHRRALMLLKHLRLMMPIAKTLVTNRLIEGHHESILLVNEVGGEYHVSEEISWVERRHQWVQILSVSAKICGVLAISQHLLVFRVRAAL